MRTVIYARFSSDNQNPRSVADQIELCRERAAREGWPVVATFEDSAISGAAGIDQAQRPGLHAMLALVEAGAADQVLAESTDRIARHVADAHIVRERIEYAGARLFTLFDGAVTPMIGLIKGFTDAQFRSDLAQRVKRGHRGSIKQGRSTGGVAYGYRRANRFDERGDLVRGLREIDADEAEIVRRIFTEYDCGQSPRAIAGRLNADGIAAPRGSYWHTTAISGSPRTSFGILRNPIYIGRLVYGRTKAVTNPVSRRRHSRPNADEENVEQDVPHLRIIDQALWDRVQQRLAEHGEGRPERARRPKHVLSGLGVCGVCGGSWTKVTGSHWGCAQFRNGRACTNNRMINTARYEQRVLAQLKEGMLSPDMVTAFVREYHADYARKQRDQERERAGVERKLAEATRRMDRLVAIVADGGREFVEIKDMLAAARDEKGRLARELASLDALPDVLTLHPRLDEEYRRQIEDLDRALAQPEAALEAVPRLRGLIARIIVRPNNRLRGVHLDVVRQLDEVLNLAKPSPKFG